MKEINPRGPSLDKQERGRQAWVLSHRDYAFLLMKPTLSFEQPATTSSEGDVLTIGETLIDNTINVEEEAITRVDNQILRHDLEMALATLTPKQRQIIRLTYFEGMPDREIADDLNSDENTVNLRRQRGLNMLRKHFGLSYSKQTNQENTDERREYQRDWQRRKAMRLREDKLKKET